MVLGHAHDTHAHTHAHAHAHVLVLVLVLVLFSLSGHGFPHLLSERERTESLLSTLLTDSRRVFPAAMVGKKRKRQKTKVHNVKTEPKRPLSRRPGTSSQRGKAKKVSLGSEGDYISTKEWLETYETGGWWTPEHNSATSEALPPPFVRISDAAEISEADFELTQTKSPWNAKKTGTLLANHQRKWTKDMDVCRYAGHVELRFVIGKNLEHKQKERLLSNLIQPLKVGNEPGETCNHKIFKEYLLRYAVFQWDANCSRDVRPISLFVLSQQNPAALKVESPEQEGLLLALQELQRCDVLWKIPLIRTSCNFDVQTLCQTILMGTELKVRVHVFFTRLLFEIISDYHLKTLMKHLVQPKESLCLPLRDPPHLSHWGELQLQKKERKEENKRLSFTPLADDHLADFESDFTLAGILKCSVSTGYERECKQPEELSLQMLHYQRETVAWMQDMESLEGGLNSLFWEKRIWNDGTGDEYWYFPMGGELRLQKPPIITGGMLCEEMGMGKTLEVLALILNDDRQTRNMSLSHKHLAPHEQHLAKGDNDKVQITSSSSLIIVPSTLLSQWIGEVDKCTRGNCVKVGVYMHSKHMSHDKLAELARNNIVFAQYSDLAAKESHLHKIHFKRIILDECQMIRSSTTKIAVKCRCLSSDHRWMVSGTPLYSSIGDLNGILAFLKIWPFSLSDQEDGFWHHRISSLWSSGSYDALHLVLGLCSKIIMRHCKNQLHILPNGSTEPILPLLGQSLTNVPLTISSSHKFVQHFVEYHCRLEFQRQLELAQMGLAEDAVRSMEGASRSRLITLPMICSTSPAIERGNNQSLHHEMDRILRKGKLYHSQSIDDTTNVGGYGIKTMPPQEAMETLMRPLAQEGNKRDLEAGFVRHDNTEKGLYNRGRSYALGLTVNEKFTEAKEKISQLEKELDLRKNINTTRWHYALECVTSGSAFFGFHRTSLRVFLRLVNRLKYNAAGDKRVVPGFREKDKKKVVRSAARLKGILDDYSLKQEGFFAECDNRILALKQYMTLLSSAIKAGGSGLSATVCEQSGFQGLIDLEEGRQPQCCICLSPVEDPVVTRCVHISCGKCLITWLEAQNALYKTGDHAPCPLCRQEFSLSTLIRVIPPSEESEQKKKSKGQGADGSSENMRRAPAICPAIEESAYENITCDQIPLRDARFPGLSRHIMFLAHSQASRSPTYLTAKEAKIKEFLERCPKLVIFSQFAKSLQFLSKKLHEWDVGFRMIVAGSSKDNKADAIGQFNQDPNCRVFLLQASAAAAGLTLTVAKTCLLLEPFLSVGDEQQAINRIHRIGQTKAVECYTLYAYGTIEERILAWRQQNENNKEDPLSVLPSEDPSLASSSKMMSFFGLR